MEAAALVAVLGSVEVGVVSQAVVVVCRLPTAVSPCVPGAPGVVVGLCVKVAALLAVLGSVEVGFVGQAVVVVRRRQVAVSWLELALFVCFLAVLELVVVVGAAGFVVVASKGRYPKVDFVFQAVAVVCRLGLALSACFPVVLGLVVVAGVAGVAAAVA